MAAEKIYQVYKQRTPEYSEYPWVAECTHPAHRPIKQLFPSISMAWKWIEVHHSLRLVNHHGPSIGFGLEMD